MAIRIKAIKPKISRTSGDLVTDHVLIKELEWEEESSGDKGVSSLDIMFDWIVNKKGQAYVTTTDTKKVPVFGAIAPAGQPYLRCLKDGGWSDELLSLPEIVG